MGAEEYRHNAAKCLELADRALDRAARLSFLDIANTWLRLSEQAEKNSLAGVLHEPPTSQAQPPLDADRTRSRTAIRV